MKKLLLGSAAVALGLALAAPAHAADGIKLGLGGYMKGYVGFTDQDNTTGNKNREFDIYRDTEVHFNGETTLDNGLTVGINAELKIDGSDQLWADESYGYFSGSWGRVNLGEEDGAAYLLQVAAPSADSNIDGLRQFVNGINTGTFQNAAFIPAAGNTNTTAGIDYANDVARNAQKLTYLTPVMSGFQAGFSYTPDLNTGLTTDVNGLTVANTSTNMLGSVHTTDVAGQYGSVYEGALRYEGQYEDVGFTAGGGYTMANLEKNSGSMDDFKEWNLGLDMNFKAFGLGVVYTKNNNGQKVNDQNKTWVVGADYTTGPFKIGASYLNNKTDRTSTDAKIDRYTGGVVYTYGPGMTFRGSVSYLEVDPKGSANSNATSVMLGTQINF